MRKQHRWIRQQLICCFIHTYTQTHHLPPTVREIGAWVGCPGMRSLQLALADLERQQYVTRDPHRRRSISLTAKGIALAQRWQLYIPQDAQCAAILHAQHVEAPMPIGLDWNRVPRDALLHGSARPIRYQHSCRESAISSGR